MSSSQVSEEKERDLVAKVELRLALADSAEKFQQGLDTFVAPLLLKLASPHASVRQAVFNVLKDILARLSSLRDVKVPVEKLISQAQSPFIQLATCLQGNRPSGLNRGKIFSTIGYAPHFRFTSNSICKNVPCIMQIAAQMGSTT